MIDRKQELNFILTNDRGWTSGFLSFDDYLWGNCLMEIPARFLNFVHFLDFCTWRERMGDLNRWSILDRAADARSRHGWVTSINSTRPHHILRLSQTFNREAPTSQRSSFLSFKETMASLRLFQVLNVSFP